MPEDMALVSLQDLWGIIGSLKRKLRGRVKEAYISDRSSTGWRSGARATWT
ncbi:MAG: hypothetical protein QI223_09825 [Candidatus Korarchaeota archaeon]|nr:hypothetical protein [Candidatus Korarchaeota archaeon]